MFQAHTGYQSAIPMLLVPLHMPSLTFFSSNWRYFWFFHKPSRVRSLYSCPCFFSWALFSWSYLGSKTQHHSIAFWVWWERKTWRSSIYSSYYWYSTPRSLWYTLIRDINTPHNHFVDDTLMVDIRCHMLTCMAVVSESLFVILGNLAEDERRSPLSMEKLSALGWSWRK